MITPDFLLGFLSCGVMVTIIGATITFIDMYKRSRYNRNHYKKHHVDAYWCQCVWCQLKRRKKIDTGELDTVVMPVVKKLPQGFKGFRH